jgi:hypothetical protein
MRSLSLISVIMLAWVVEFALPHFPLLDDVMREGEPAESGYSPGSSSHIELPRQRIGAGALPQQFVDAILPVAGDNRKLQQQGETQDNNVFRRGMGDGGRTTEAGQKRAQDGETTSTTTRMGRMMSSSGKGKGKGGMSPNRNPSSLVLPGKGKGIDNGEGCWVIIGGDGWGGSSKSKKGASKHALWNWGSMWGPHKVWDPQCRLPCYDDWSSKSKGKKAKGKKGKGKGKGGKGKGKGGSSKSGPQCPMVKPTPIIPTPSAPTNMMMVPTRRPTMGATPTRRPTIVTRAPVPSGTRRPTVAPTAETLAPVPTVTNRTNTTTTTAPVLVNSTAPARRF